LIEVAWSKGAVRVILTNPRYTGRQVWNKQRKQEILIDINDVALGHATKLRWNPIDNWIHSDRPAHPTIVDQDTFDRAQEVLRSRGPGSPKRVQHRARHPYQLRSRIYCGCCQRRMQGEWIRDAAYYRCRFPREYALANKVEHPPNVYLREDAVTPHLERWLARAFAPSRLTSLVDQLYASQDAGEDIRDDEARRAVADADRPRRRHRTRRGTVRVRGGT
jgi:site-specific DNA recombinase